MEIIREGGAAKKVGGGSTGGREIAMEIIREGGKSGGSVEIVSSRTTTTQVQVSLLVRADIVWSIGSISEAIISGSGSRSSLICFFQKNSL